MTKISALLQEGGGGGGGVGVGRGTRRNTDTCISCCSPCAILKPSGLKSLFSPILLILKINVL